jgi:hypothetical protein
VGDGENGRVNPSRSKTFWKLLLAVLFFPMVASIFVDISMYWWPSIPSTPRIAEGQIYPLNNHGRHTYMNREEYLFDESVKWIVFPVGTAIAAIDYFVDPFDHKRKRRIYGRPPRDFR